MNSNIRLNRKDYKGKNKQEKHNRNCNSMGVSVSPSEEKQGKLEQNISSRVTETWMEFCSCEILRGTCLVGEEVGGEK